MLTIALSSHNKTLTAQALLQTSNLKKNLNFRSTTYHTA
jgi:hypothetical protein